MSLVNRVRDSIFDLKEQFMWSCLPEFRVKRARDVITENGDSWFFIQGSGLAVDDDLAKQKKKALLDSLIVKRLAFQNLGATMMVKGELVRDLSDSLFSRNVAHQRLSLNDFTDVTHFTEQLRSYKCGTVVIIGYTERHNERFIEEAVCSILEHMCDMRESLASRSARYVQGSVVPARHLLVLDDLVRFYPRNLIELSADLQNSVVLYSFNDVGLNSLHDDSSKEICASLMQNSITIACSLDAVKELGGIEDGHSAVSSQCAKKLARLARRYDEQLSHRSLIGVSGETHILDSR